MSVSQPSPTNFHTPGESRTFTLPTDASRPGDLPALWAPDGYLRHADSRWRYQDGGGVVPKARDVTIERLWRFPRQDGMFIVGLQEALYAPELFWCRAFADDQVSLPRKGRVPARRAIAVPEEEWEDRCHVPLGIDAPELSPCRLVGVEMIAEMEGVSKETVRSWSHRGVLRAPVLCAPTGPLWSIPVVLRCLALRDPSNTARSDATRTRSLSVQKKRTPRPAAPYRSQEHDTEAVALGPSPTADLSFSEWFEHLDRQMNRTSPPASTTDHHASGIMGHDEE